MQLALELETAAVSPSRLYADAELASVTVGSGSAALLRQSCAICLETFEAAGTVCILPCSHTFCAACIKTWLRTNNSCPTCRQPVVEPGDEARDGGARPVSPSGVQVNAVPPRGAPPASLSRLTKILVVAFAFVVTIGFFSLLFWATGRLQTHFRPSVDARGVTVRSNDGIGGGGGSGGGSGRASAPAPPRGVRCLSSPPLTASA